MTARAILPRVLLALAIVGAIRSALEPTAA